MWHKDLTAMTSVIQAKAEAEFRLEATTGGYKDRRVVDEAMRLSSALAEVLDYPLPARALSERRIVEEHVNLQAAMFVALRALKAGDPSSRIT